MDRPDQLDADEAAAHEMHDEPATRQLDECPGYLQQTQACAGPDTVGKGLKAVNALVFRSCLLE